MKNGKAVVIRLGPFDVVTTYGDSITVIGMTVDPDNIIPPVYWAMPNGNYLEPYSITGGIASPIANSQLWHERSIASPLKPKSKKRASIPTGPTSRYFVHPLVATCYTRLAQQLYRSPDGEFSLVWSDSATIGRCQRCHDYIKPMHLHWEMTDANRYHLDCAPVDLEAELIIGPNFGQAIERPDCQHCSKRLQPATKIKAFLTVRCQYHQKIVPFHPACAERLSLEGDIRSEGERRNLSCQHCGAMIIAKRPLTMATITTITSPKIEWRFYHPECPAEPPPRRTVIDTSSGYDAFNRRLPGCFGQGRRR